MAGLTIARLAKAADVGVETVRYYQRRGLLAVPDGAGSVRRYDGGDVQRLRFIRAAQGAGFSLDEIGRLLAFDPVTDRPSIRALAEQRIKSLDAQIRSLEVSRTALARLARECGKGDAGPCPILEAFEG
ncbi:MerR family transcriptional regulator [Sphingomonas humi]|uniref:MerR family DNA-binding protein n=1 Tax=Sphingomonas humi TaxID=335630 RepID=A0ABP7SEZ8_9SPHN